MFSQPVTGKTGQIPGLKGNISMVSTGLGGSVGGFGADMTFATRADNAANMSERMRIASTGNVGIGTATPQAKLDVNGTAKFTSTVSLFNGSATMPSIVLDPTTSQITVGGQPLLTATSTTAQTFSAPSYSFNNGSTSRMTIDSSGNVGIGKTNPQSKLDIAGSIASTGLAVSGYVDFYGSAIGYSCDNYTDGLFSINESKN